MYMFYRFISFVCLHFLIAYPLCGMLLKHSYDRFFFFIFVILTNLDVKYIFYLWFYDI